MNAAELKALQGRRGWRNAELAAVLNEALDRNYTADQVTKWRSGKVNVPKHVQAFLGGLDGQAPPAAAPLPPPADRTGIPEVDAILDEAERDTAPSGAGAGAGAGAESERDDRPRPSLTLVAGGPGAYAKICEEFFELIATGVGMIGAAIGSPSVQQDGRIILDDKAELGRAWGKLAEQNETFARILTATDKQGAYLAVALATGTTAGRIFRNHQPPPEPRLHSLNGDDEHRDRGPAAEPPSA